MRKKLALVLLFATAAAVANAQTWDSSGNGLLKGNYYFREVITTSAEAVSIYGNITFDGNGNSSISGAKEFYCNTSTCYNPTDYTATGTYSISSSGFGFLSNQSPTRTNHGSVGANGVFVGSSTEDGFNDLFIAAPISGQGTSTLNGSYSLSYLEPFGNSLLPAAFDALMQFTANGSGSVGNVSLSVYVANSTPTPQTISGVKYYVNNNAFVLQFPTNSSTNLLFGNEYLYSTPDGSFVFGGSPQDFDMIVGVRTSSTSSPTLSGLYFEAGMEIDNTQLSTVGSFLDTFYGSLTASTNATIVGHQRILSGTTAASYVYHDAIPTPLTASYTDIARSRQFIIGNGVRIGVGIAPYPAVTVAVQAGSVTPTSGVYLNPRGPLNAASDAPFTSGISPGELIVLNGSGLGPSYGAFSPTVPVAKTVGGAQLLINGAPVPILEASSTEITALVPYGISSSIATIQASYKGALSNTISTLVNLTTPGVFTTPAGGVNRATAQHSNGTLVTPSNPARIGETVLVYMTGLGAVYPAIVDGGIGPVVTHSTPTNLIAVYVDSLVATPTFIGLAPGLVGLYEMKLPIPTGVTIGDVYLSVSGPDSYSSQAIISVAAATTGAVSSETSDGRRMPPRSTRPLVRIPPRAVVSRDGLVRQ